jgi:2-methylfumaryl-CoA hydratase
MGKGWQGNFFEDFELGASTPCPTPRVVTTGDLSNYIALTGDRTPRFCSGEGLVHPLITFHLVLGQTVRQISLNARANLGYANMVWPTPLRINDIISTEIKVVGLKENSTGTTGIAWVETVGRNQDEQVVLSYTRWVMVKKRGAEATPYLDAPVVPTLPKSVSVDALPRRSGAPLPKPAHTGGRWAFEDYEVGERVLHYDGMTVNHSDHMSFTRLFQNSAKVHFDEVLTEGKPLVYGGVPVSYGYAQAFNGFENRLGICALNGGAHANPIYAGDTIYSFTEVLETADLGDESRVGALRLRLVCVKNAAPDESTPVMIEDPKRPGKQQHNPSVVLDFDFWELMPKRAHLG